MENSNKLTIEALQRDIEQLKAKRDKFPLTKRNQDNYNLTKHNELTELIESKYKQLIKLI